MHIANGLRTDSSVSYIGDFSGQCSLSDQVLFCRVDAQKLEDWARAQSPTSLVDFASRNGEVEDTLKDIAERAGSKGCFSYSRFFAVGLFRLLELANATEPTILDKVTWFGAPCLYLMCINIV